MSVRVMSLVWQKAPYKGNTLLTLLALADWSDDEGLSWPKLESVAQKSRQSVRSAQYALDQLTHDCVLSVERNPGRGNRSEYRINLQKLHLFDMQNATEKGANSARKGAKRDSAIRKNHQDPSIEPSGDCPKCGNSGTYPLKAHPGREGYCWCAAGIALQRKEKPELELRA